MAERDESYRGRGSAPESPVGARESPRARDANVGSDNEGEFDDDEDMTFDSADFDERDGGFRDSDTDTDSEAAGGGAGVLGCVSYLWMLVAMGIFAYLIVTVQSQADVIKTMQRKVATMEQRLGLSPMMTASEL